MRSTVKKTLVVFVIASIVHFLLMMGMIGAGIILFLDGTDSDTWPTPAFRKEQAVVRVLVSPLGELRDQHPIPKSNSPVPWPVVSAIWGAAAGVIFLTAVFLTRSTQPQLRPITVGRDEFGE